MITCIAVETMVWSKAESRKTIMTPIIVIRRSASVKCAVVKIQTQSLVHYRSAPAPQHEFLNLSGRRLRQFIHEVKRARNLEMRQRGAGKIMQLSLRRGLTGAQNDECVGRFTPFFMRHADHRNLEHGRVAQQRALDFDRGDVLAAADDDVLEAVSDLDVAIGMHDRAITGMKPAAG